MSQHSARKTGELVTVSTRRFRARGVLMLAMMDAIHRRCVALTRFATRLGARFTRLFARMGHVR